MERILLVLDPEHLSTQTIDFSCYLAQLTRSKLTGLFVEYEHPVASEGVRAYFDKRQPVGDGTTDGPPGSRETSLAALPADKFRQSCDARGTEVCVREQVVETVNGIIEESRYSDLLVMDIETTFSTRGTNTPNVFVKDILQRAECPVILAPYSFESIDEIVFAYDGSESSVYAIKQFTYLLPAFMSKKVVIVEVSERDTAYIEKPFRMKEWLNAHYNTVEVKMLKGQATTELFSYLIEKKNTLLVMGAYGRTLLSNFFRPSHAGLIVRTVNLPIFITHH